MVHNWKNRGPKLLLACGGIVLAVGGMFGQGRNGATGKPAMPVSRPAVPGIHGLVTAGHPLASMAGLQVLMKGGNAVDAAIAVGTTLNMMEPQMNGIGGNGFMTIYEKRTGKVYALAMTGATPAAFKAEEMTPESLNVGMKAGIIPGNFGGYVAALQRFGTMSLGEVAAPGIDYAEHGYAIDASLVVAITRAQKQLMTYPTTANLFFPGGHALEPGQLFKNPNLATTLKKVVASEQAALKEKKSRVEALQAAFDRFYKGDIAQEFDRFFKENRGYITAADLAAYKPIWSEPLHSTYRGYDIYSSPATSRGGFEIEMALNLVEPYDLAKMGAGSPEALHLLIEAIKLSKSDIYHYVADPRFTTIPVDGLLSKSYASNRRKLIEPAKAMAYPNWGEPDRPVADARRPKSLFTRPSAGPAFDDDYEIDRNTTSFSIVDQYGNAVSCTPTIGGIFGAGVVVGNTGLLLNNGDRLGSSSPYPDNVNYARSGHIPLLNNSPTIVLKGGKVAMVFGSPGGETIGQTEFQMLVSVLDFHLPVQEAVEAPRFTLDAKPNFYKPGSEISISIENRIPESSLRTLEAWGHHLNVVPGFASSAGRMQTILVDLENGTMAAGADPRGTGYAVGW